MSEMTELELTSIVKHKIKNKKSSGFDEISGSLIKQVLKPIVGVLTYIVNLSFEQGHFPEMLKMNKIVPIYKKGNAHLAENYRPVALIPIFSKIFEYCFLSRLEPFLTCNKVVSPYQFGFRQHCSTMTAIQHFYERLMEHLEHGECPAGVFCDLSRAFDCVNHRLLLNKMEAYGVRGSALGWLESFLTNRRQYVSVSYKDPGNGGRSCDSDVTTISLGVPQGSVLGPSLFVCYINDLISVVDPGWAVALFADDSSFIMSSQKHQDLENICNSGMSTILEWFNNNSLYLNSSKTTYIRFHTPQNKRDHDLNLKVGEENISRSSSSKFLGLTIDQNLNWKEHCSTLCSKLNSLCYMIRNLRAVLPLAELLSVYNAYVGSRLHYGICFWGASSASKDVFVTQKRVVRCMLGVSQGTSCRSQFARLNILTLTGILIYELGKFVYLNKTRFLQNCDIHDHLTRSKDNLYMPKSRLNVSKYSPHNLGRVVFNSLPQHIKEAQNLSIFKKQLKIFLVKHEFYSLDDFWTSV